MTTRLCREMLEKKAWMPLGVLVAFLRQLFSFLDEMVRYGDDDTQEAAMSIQRQVFYEMQMLELLKTLIESYEPHRTPPAFMADCAIMAHVVLRQVDARGASNSLRLCSPFVAGPIAAMLTRRVCDRPRVMYSSRAMAVWS